MSRQAGHQEAGASMDRLANGTTQQPITAAGDELERRLFQLETLYEIGRECSRVHTVDDVLHIMLSMLMGAFGAVRGIAFTGTPAGEIEALRARGARPESGTQALARQYLQSRADGPLLEAGFEVVLPFAGHDASHGALALGPKLTGQPFTAEDRALLATIVANAALYLHNVGLLSAIRATAKDLERKVRALAVVNQIALGIPSRTTARRLYQFLLEQVVGSLPAAEAALALPSSPQAADGQAADGQFTKGELMGVWQVAARFSPDLGGDMALDEAELVARLATGAVEQRRHGRHGHELVAPIRYGQETTGAIWVRRRAHDPAFDTADGDLLQLLANELAVILEHSRLFERFLVQQQERFRLCALLEQYVAPAVAERLISNQDRPTLGGSRQVVTVLMVDMRGSTEITTKLDLEITHSLMNDYLGLITNILFQFEGTIDRIEGDGIVALFGAPEVHPDDPQRALYAAALMQHEFTRALARWRAAYPLPASIGIGVGIATGEVVVGNIGSAKRLHYTTTGPTINLASRLSRGPAGTVQMDERTWRIVDETLHVYRGRPTKRPLHLRAKGFAELIPVYRLRPAELMRLSVPAPAAPG